MRVTTVLTIKNATVSKSQNVKDRSHANKYLRKVKVNLQTEVEICISTYLNADNNNNNDRLMAFDPGQPG